MIDLVHANQPRRELKHVVAQRDDDELGVLGALLDVVGNDRDLRTIRVSQGEGGTYVSEIQRGIDLVHDIQRSRLVVVQGENESQTAQRLFTTRKVADVLPTLLWWHDTEQDTFAEGIQTVDKF
ncbi:hypothetical protein HG530_011942 [Fusarium avenaceum]|nr:hypothetical protein HG530_011942 [Fusarium avenaceum]